MSINTVQNFFHVRIFVPSDVTVGKHIYTFSGRVAYVLGWRESYSETPCIYGTSCVLVAAHGLIWVAMHTFTEAHSVFPFCSKHKHHKTVYLCTRGRKTMISHGAVFYFPPLPWRRSSEDFIFPWKMFHGIFIHCVNKKNSLTTIIYHFLRLLFNRQTFVYIVSMPPNQYIVYFTLDDI